MTLTPAYGRDYKSAKAAKADYNADKDFVINDVSSPWDGSYVNKSQLKDQGNRPINIRFNQLRKVTVI